MDQGRLKTSRIIALVFAVILLGSLAYVYFNYLSLKKSLISRISYKASSVIGQKVRIGDISLSLPGGIDIHDIVVENPEGFGEGQLLKTMKISLSMRLRELLHKRLSIKEIEIDAPELSLLRDEKGRLNISDTLRQFLSKEGIRYRIDVLKINSGAVYINKDQRLLHSDIRLTLKNLSSEPGTKTMIALKAVSLGKGKLSVDGWAYLQDKPRKFSLSASMEKIDMFDLASLSTVEPGLSGMPYKLSGDIAISSFEGAVESGGGMSGRVALGAKNLSVIKSSDNRPALSNVSIDSSLTIGDKNLDFVLNAHAKNLSAALSGTVNDFMGESRSLKMKLTLPETKALEVRNALWDSFPDGLLYVGLGGTVACDASIKYERQVLNAEGNLRIKNLTIEGENKEYYIGQVNGTLPLRYKSDEKTSKPSQMPDFEKGEFENLRRYYAEGKDIGSALIKIGSLRYGFKLLEGIELRVRQSNAHLNIASISATIFGGSLNGSAVVDIAGKDMGYRAGFVVKGISLTRLCEDIPPIKGYSTGKVDGMALLKGSGGGMEGLLGRADFWSYSTKDEATIISREFLEKVGGPSVKPYLRERKFSKGIVSLYIQNGFLIFKELEISNKNMFGMQDLSVKVAPFNNRIAIDHLMSSITEAAERAKKSE